MQALVTLLMIAAFGYYYYYVTNKRKKALANIGPAVRKFFERTGYRYAELQDAPLEQQVSAAEAKFVALQTGQSGKAFELHLVRDFHGLPVHHEQYVGAPSDPKSKFTRVMRCNWTARLASSPAVLWQAADKSLSGAGKAVKEAFSNSTRQWEPEYPQRIESGDPDLDKRFQFYGLDADAVRRVLRTAGLKDLLLGATEVDLCVRNGEVVFADPFQKNLRSGLGGTVGAMTIGFDVDKMFDLATPVHERITELVALSARASQ